MDMKALVIFLVMAASLCSVQSEKVDAPTRPKDTNSTKDSSNIKFSNSTRPLMKTDRFPKNIDDILNRIFIFGNNKFENSVASQLRPFTPFTTHTILLNLLKYADGLLNVRKYILEYFQLGIKKPVEISPARKIEIIEYRKQAVLMYVSDENARSKISEFFDTEKDFISVVEGGATFMTVNPESQKPQQISESAGAFDRKKLKLNLCRLGMKAVTSSSQHLPLEILLFLDKLSDKYCEED